jgi:predicted phage terminase large subunit-like protein
MHWQISRSEAAKELLRRRQIRRNLIDWCRFAGYEPAAHHRLLIDKLEQVSRGELDRLAIFMPPGAAKSTYSSILFPPHFLARYPRADIIAASHTVELAERWGRRVRNLIHEHSLTLGVSLADDSQAAGRWATSEGGIYYAAGAGKAISGWRADLVVIDDPFGSREDADSEVIREKIWDWYRGDIIGRLKPSGRIVLIQTRWHEDDLSGRILDAMAAGGDRWEVVSLPAIAEADDPLGRVPGEPLWPEWESLDQLNRKRLIVGARDWSALYQQRPAPEDGDFFKREWLRPYEKAPPIETLRVYGGSDYAVTADGGDYTVHVVVGLDPEGRMYLLDLWRAQSSSDVWIEAFCDLVKQWRPVGWACETGQISSGIGPYLDRRQIERQAYVYRELFPTRGDKAIRAQSIRGRMALESLYVPTGAEWYPSLRSELLSFPAGKHDDQVDALGLVGQLLDKMSKGSPIPKPEPNKNPSGYRTYNDGQASNDWISF